MDDRLTGLPGAERACALRDLETASVSLIWSAVIAVLLADATAGDDALDCGQRSTAFPRPHLQDRDEARATLVDPRFTPDRRLMAEAAGWEAGRLCEIGRALAAAGWREPEPGWRERVLLAAQLRSAGSGRAH